MTRRNQLTTLITLSAVLILFGLAFILSYSNLADFATNAGYQSWLVWLFPLLLDLAVLIFSGFHLVVTVQARPDSSHWYTWPTKLPAMLGLSIVSMMILSVIFNVATFSTAQGFVAHSLPPVLVFVTTHLAAKFVASLLQESGAGEVAESAELVAENERLQFSLEKAQTELDELQELSEAWKHTANDYKAKIKPLQETATNLQAELDAAQKSLESITAFLGEDSDTRIKFFANIIPEGRGRNREIARLANVQDYAVSRALNGRGK